MQNRLVRAAIVSSVLACAGCPGPATPPDAPSQPDPVVAAAAPTATAPTARKPNVISGRATTEDGRPLERVAVAISGSSSQGGYQRFSVLTDADGAYSIEVPEGAYRVDAWVQTSYQGAAYELRLCPREETSRDLPSRDGIVMDFAWRTSGPLPYTRVNPDDPSTTVGGALQLSPRDAQDVNAESFVLPAEGATLEVSLTPTGPLIDGAAGRAVTFTRKVSAPRLELVAWTELQWTNIPVGAYTATARLLRANGSSTPLRVASATAQTQTPALAASATVVFPPGAGDHSPLSGVRSVTLYVRP